MEGNSLFPLTCRNPSDEDIKHATEKDDADAKQLDLDIKQLFDEFRGLGESKSIEGSILIDLLQHRVEPLMERAAEIGVPSALQHIPNLQNFMTSTLEVLRSSSEHDELSVDPLRKVWRRKTNVFIAQAWRDDTPIAKADRVLALLCEDVGTINEVLELYGELDAELIPKMAEIARLHFQMAELDGFNLPGAEEKIDLFSHL
jgi:hypothetical protein